MSVSAIVVTRGDVDCDEIVNSFPPEWETILWNNGSEYLTRWTTPDDAVDIPIRDLSVYGRYAAVEYATGDLIYVQDDDCLVSDPTHFISAWIGNCHLLGPVPADGSDLFNAVIGTHVVCNMPPEFRYSFYDDHALVGFGSVFHKSLPATTWGRLTARFGNAGFPMDWAYEPNFLRTCDIPFTGLNPRILVDVPKTNLPWADAPDRMWMQPEHQAERARMLELVRDAA